MQTRAQLSVALGLLALAALACNTLAPPRPAVAWDPAAGNLVVEARSSGGMLLDPNHIPSARLWGDGRLIWATFDASQARRVQTRSLPAEEMRALLQSIVNAGFFGWKDLYSPGQVMDAPSTCLTVTLTSQAHAVCEVLSGAPAGFERLYAELASGAGQAGTEFVPQRGYFTASVLGANPAAGAGPVTDWPGASLGVRLDQSSAGVWLDGPALALAWQVVNANSLYPLAREDGQYYTLRLLVPAVTLVEPP